MKAVCTLMPKDLAASATLSLRSSTSKNLVFSSGRYAVPEAQSPSSAYMVRVARFNSSSPAAWAMVPKRVSASKKSCRSPSEYTRRPVPADPHGAGTDFRLVEEPLVDSGSIVVDTPHSRGCCNDR